jgi:hypothetical protein
MPRTFGAELVQKIADGSLAQAPSEYLVKTRDEVSEAIEEIFDVGARIRPLLIEGKRVGWVRGVHLSERKLLKRWVAEDVEFIEQLLLAGTTLTQAEIQDLSMLEVRSVLRVIRTMTDSDLRLFPYISAFTTTSQSEQLWFSRGVEGSLFRERAVEMPDGKRIRILAASDQARLWAALCNYRIQAKARLEASFNAVMIVRAWVGKQADALSHDLKTLARDLLVNSMEPWKDIIRVRKESNFDDGWAHVEDDSIEGMQREMHGMLNFDRHEQAVASIWAQEQARAEKRQRKIEEQITSKRIREEQEDTGALVVMTEDEVRTHALDWRRTHAAPFATPDAETQSSLEDRLARYR